MSLWHAVGENDQKMFNRIMDEAVIRPLDSGDVYRAMECAAKRGFVLYLEQLAPHASIEVCSNAFSQAAAMGNHTCLTPILPYVLHDQESVRRAFKQCADNSLLVGALMCYPADCNHVACLEILAPLVQKKDVNEVLSLLGGQCSVDILNVLIKYADPKHNNSRALQKAVLENAQHNIDILYPISDPSAALKALQESIVPSCIPQDWMPLYERIESDRLKNVLNTELAASSASVRTSKM